MSNTDQKKRPPRFLLAMPDQTRIAIERAAFSAGRTVTAEINLRLKASLKAEQQSLPPSYTAPPPVTRHTTGEEKSPADPLTEIDRAMLAVFRQLPVDKQLALLSLFR